MRYRLVIHESGTIDFAADIPGVMEMSFPEPGDPVVETQLLDEGEYNSFKDKQRTHLTTYDHKRKKFVHTLRSSLTIRPQP